MPKSITFKGGYDPLFPAPKRSAVTRSNAVAQDITRPSTANDKPEKAADAK